MMKLSKNDGYYIRRVRNIKPDGKGNYLVKIHITQRISDLSYDGHKRG
jgi:hypothetical protein